MTKGANAQGVPKRTGGYNYSTDQSQNTLFNHGVDPRHEGVPGDVVGYAHGTQENKARMYRMRKHNVPSLGRPGTQPYGTMFNKAATLRKSSKARNKK